MNYNLGERVKPKSRWRLMPLMFTLVILLIFALTYFYATGHVNFNQVFLPGSK